MNSLTKNILIIISVSFFMSESMIFAQSDTPCGAPNLPVNVNCSNTTATISGSDNQQTNSANGGTPSCGSMGEDVWFSFTAPSTGVVNFAFTSGSISDAVAAVYNGPCTAPTEISCNDDGGPGLMPALSVSSLTPGNTYYLRIWEYGGGTGNLDVCAIAGAAPPTNISCNVPDPICSGSPITFTAQANGTQASTVDPGNNYDCLISQPNPSWYYLKIATGGVLAMDITAGSDVDFAIWGPYPSVANAIANCGSYAVPLDCSFSTSATEQANVPACLAGEVYVLLVTNYANVVQAITVSDAPTNTAVTDCSIVLPVELSEFEAVSTDHDVDVTWKTVTENNNDYFILERSLDAQSWSTIAIKDGVGNSSQVVNYQFTDRNVENEIAYYRLKQVDFDGAMHLSKIISVNPNQSFSVQLVPNPAKSKVTIKANDHINKVEIISVNGNSKEIIETPHSSKVSLNLDNYFKGIYYLKIHSTTETIIEKLIVL